MRYKATLVIGIAAGYVLGARAGRQRYEQIKRLTQTVKKNPAVQQAADKVQAQAMHLGDQSAPRRAGEGRFGRFGSGRQGDEPVRQPRDQPRRRPHVRERVDDLRFASR